MTDTVSDLAARLAALEDKEAIRLLKSRYLRACDLKDVEAVRDSFDPVEVRIAYQGFPVYSRRDDFVETFRQMGCQPGVFDIHHATNWDIELIGTDEAKGLWSLNFRTILVGQRQVTRLAVEYEDIYRRRDGRWYIAESVSKVTSLITEEVGADGAIKVLAYGEMTTPAAQPA